jgi:hypothetical protein
MIKLIDMLNELSTWFSYSDEEITAATKSNITTDNTPEFARFVSDWGAGDYDEDSCQADRELKYFIKK